MPRSYAFSWRSRRPCGIGHPAVAIGYVGQHSRRCGTPSRQPFLIMGATPSPHSPVNQKRTFRKRGNRRQLQALDLMKQASIGLLKKERSDL
jgi:hypothetical protein